MFVFLMLAGILDSNQHPHQDRIQEESAMAPHRIYAMSFSSVYPLYIQKAEKKGRTKDDVDTIICWLTGYTRDQLDEHVKNETTIETFIRQSPSPNPARSKITGSVCGVRLDQIEDPIMKEIRYLDKLIDELAKGKAMEKILRA